MGLVSKDGVGGIENEIYLSYNMYFFLGGKYSRHLKVNYRGCPAKPAENGFCYRYSIRFTRAEKSTRKKSDDVGKIIL